MGVVVGLGYFLIALGPALTIFFSSIAPKPFLTLTVLASALIYLVSLVAAAIIWRAFLPGPSWVFLLMLATAVFIQEVTRIFYWRFFLKTEKYLNVLAVKLSKPQLNFVDRLEVSFASGVGHGVAHAIFFGLSVIAPAFGPATYYTESCKEMPFFLVSALLTLAFFLLHTFSMVIAFNAYTHGVGSQKLFVPVMHLGASFLTLINLLPNGCIVGVPLVFLCTLVTMVYGDRIVWENTDPNFLNHSSLQSMHSGSSL
ncbi:gamma-secretase subunit APH1-like [Physcomitrium patens]|uniref:Gamma-secretase subunit Aph-1 n=1 Tax=Physcomitrium patens TaxID=3218 RepID=A0A2K1JXW1_PHYPA|nr:gamma-secretase subunit APH1-like [Physcomitrium patens]PNR46364.1 hypothetical protein PHYPA_013483 [Physcomitrium patens]|eukprot:XP_024385828.1 gamma-secretase subunit APH1-like [Physcomitrella patens]